MTVALKSFTSSRLRPHLSFAVLAVATVALFWRTLRELAALALSADSYSYILLIPVISAFVLYLERRKVFAGIGTYRSPVIAALLAGAVAICGLFALNVVTPPADYLLSIGVVSILLVWAAAFALCYGPPALAAAKFPFLLLLLLVPIPLNWMERVVTTLQWGAAEATHALFQLAGVPVFRDGVNFQLPIVNIEIARECSSIHSACALFVTGLLVGHLFLGSLGAKISLTLLTVPIAMFTNAVRIVTLWFLATKVDIGFLYGRLHRNGGILFSLTALLILLGCVYLLRKLEGRGRPPDASRLIDRERGDTSNEDWASRSDPAPEIAKL
jgi:exosortase